MTFRRIMSSILSTSEATSGPAAPTPALLTAQSKRPKLLMVDELSLGLAPKVVDRLIDAVREINREGMALLLVEQDVLVALDAASRAYVLETGRIVLKGESATLRDDPEVQRAYLGT